MDRLSLPDLTRQLRGIAESTGASPPSYCAVAGRVRDGDIPAERDRRQWWVRTADLPAAAAIFGLAPPPEQPPHHQRAA